MKSIYVDNDGNEWQNGGTYTDASLVTLSNGTTVQADSNALHSKDTQIDVNINSINSGLTTTNIYSLPSTQSFGYFSTINIQYNAHIVTINFNYYFTSAKDLDWWIIGYLPSGVPKPLDTVRGVALTYNPSGVAFCNIEQNGAIKICPLENMNQYGQLQCSLTYLV